MPGINGMSVTGRSESGVAMTNTSIGPNTARTMEGNSAHLTTGALLKPKLATVGSIAAMVAHGAMIVEKIGNSHTGPDPVPHVHSHKEAVR